MSCNSSHTKESAPQTMSTLSSENVIKRLDGSLIEADSLGKKIQTLIEAANVTGLAVSIFNEREVAYKKAFGFSDIRTKKPLSTDQVFYGASLSKSVFGFLVAKLVSEGKLDLDKPLQDYLNKPLPEYEFKKEWKGYKDLADDERYQLITARMCLSHMTGFPNFRWFTKEFDFDRNGKIRFLVDPGTRYSYSGEGMNLLQFVIEEITGKDLEELAQEYVFQPLEMSMTSYIWQDRFEGKFCFGHDKNQEVIGKDKEDEPGAAGSMETTIDDYSLLFNEVFKLHKSQSEITKSLFRPNTRIKSKVQFGASSWEDTAENDDIELSYGLGWGLLQSPYGFGAFKEGHGEGFQHYSILFPDSGVGIIIMSNSDNAESIFKELLALTIGDIYTPWKWERYIPYDMNKK